MQLRKITSPKVSRSSCDLSWWAVVLAPSCPSSAIFEKSKGVIVGCTCTGIKSYWQSTRIIFDARVTHSLLYNTLTILHAPVSHLLNLLLLCQLCCRRGATSKVGLNISSQIWLLGNETSHLILYENLAVHICFKCSFIARLKRKSTCNCIGMSDAPALISTTSVKRLLSLNTSKSCRAHFRKRSLISPSASRILLSSSTTTDETVPCGPWV